MKIFFKLVGVVAVVAMVFSPVSADAQKRTGKSTAKRKLVSNTRQATSAPKYQIFQISCNGYMLATAQKMGDDVMKWSLVDSLGNHIYGPVSGMITGVDANGNIAVSGINDSNKAMLLRKNGQLIKEFNCDLIPLGDKFYLANYPMSDNGAYNCEVYDGDGHKVAGPFPYYINQITPSGNFVASYFDNEGTQNTFILDHNGNKIGGSFNDIGTFSEGLALAVKDGKMGFIDEKGYIVIPFDYDIDESWGDGGDDTLHELKFVNGVAPIYKDGYYGAIDKSGKVIVPIKYSYGSIGSKGTLVFSDPSYSYNIVYSSTGKLLNAKRPISYSNPDGAILVYGSWDEPWYATDATGKIVIAKGIYDNILPFAPGSKLTLAKKNNRWHIIDSTGKIVVRNFAVNNLAELVG